MKTKRARKPNFSELIGALQILCRAEKASILLCDWLNQSVGSYDDAQVYLPQVIARTESQSPVIAQLAKQALTAR